MRCTLRFNESFLCMYCLVTRITHIQYSQYVFYTQFSTLYMSMDCIPFSRCNTFITGSGIIILLERVLNVLLFHLFQGLLCINRYCKQIDGTIIQGRLNLRIDIGDFQKQEKLGNHQKSYFFVFYYIPSSQGKLPD